jgi:hypothetical protein
MCVVLAHEHRSVRRFYTTPSSLLLFALPGYPHLPWARHVAYIQGDDIGDHGHATHRKDRIVFVMRLVIVKNHIQSLSQTWINLISGMRDESYRDVMSPTYR